MYKPIDLFYRTTITAVSGIYLYLKFTSGDFSGGANLGSAITEYQVPPVPKGAKSLLQAVETYNASMDAYDLHIKELQSQPLSPEAQVQLKAIEQFKADYKTNHVPKLIKGAELKALIAAIDAASIESERKPDLLSNLIKCHHIT